MPERRLHLTMSYHREMVETNFLGSIAIAKITLEPAAGRCDRNVSANHFSGTTGQAPTQEPVSDALGFLVRLLAHQAVTEAMMSDSAKPVQSEKNIIRKRATRKRPKPPASITLANAVEPCSIAVKFENTTTRSQNSKSSSR